MVVNSMSYAKYERYKDSGVDWLGAIPSDWQSKKLGILLTEFSKKNNPNLPLLSITRELGVITRDMDDQESNHNFIPDDLSGYKLLKEGQFGMNKMKAWQGSYGISKYTGIVSPAYYVFDVSNEIYPNFFNIAIRSKFYVDFFGSASDGVRIGQWDLNKTRMREIPFIFPSLEQQKKIYEFLSKKIKQIDQAISLKQQQIEKLNEYKQIVIQNAVTKGLNPNAPMKNSGVDWIGDIPEHWQMKRLKYVLDERNERSKTGEEPLFMVSQKYGLVVRADYHEKAEVAQSNIDNKIVYKNDLVFNKLKPHLGVFYKSEIDFKGLVSPDYAVYKVKNYIYDMKYLEILFRNPKYIEQFIIRATGIVEGLIRLYTTSLFELPVMIPPKEEQEAILKFVKIENDKIDISQQNVEKQIDRLKEYKNILINQAVTGKIKI